MTELDYSIAMSRCLLGTRDREAPHIRIEKIFIKIMKANGLNTSDFINLAIENELKRKGLLDKENLDSINELEELELIRSKVGTKNLLSHLKKLVES